MDHERHEITVQESTSSYGRIVVEPLERGYGVTLGNSLRRVLLSSISGAAVVAVRIDGVLHEFSTIAGVKEDVIEILVNLKHIPVRCHSTSVRILHLEAKGPKAVTVSDIDPDSEVEFPDPEAYICTLEEGHSVSWIYTYRQAPDIRLSTVRGQHTCRLTRSRPTHCFPLSSA